MATLFGADRPVRGSEERFFFQLACAIALVIVAGFAVNLAAGRSSFAVPLIFHLHALVFFGWIALFLVQSGLVAAGNVALHRRLGWLSVVWLPAMAVLGVILTVTSLRRHGGPPFFDANEFLVGNISGLLGFGAVVATAIVLRRRTDWHRRLMISAMAMITGPGFGRLLPAPLLIPWAWWITNLVGLGFIVAGMVRDKRHRGSVHPAWFAGMAALVGIIALGEWIAYTDWGFAVTREVLAGYPGAARPMAAYLP